MKQPIGQMYINGEYLLQNPTWHEEDAPLKKSAIIKLIQRNQLKPRHIADIGCGTGSLLSLLYFELPEAETFVGFDVSEHAINIALDRQNEKLKFYKSESFSSVQNSHYDLLLVIDVIEHLENYFQFLRKIYKSSCHYIFHIPLDMSVWSLFREKMLIESKERVGHIHNFTEDFIIAVLKDHGYTVTDKLYTPPSYEIWHFKARLIDYLRRALFFTNKKLATKMLGGYSIMILAKT